MKKYIANIITSFRIILSTFIVFLPILSYRFYLVYFLCGISDMIDGRIARKMNIANEYGEKFDTVADFIFVLVSLVKILPILNIPVWLWIWIVVIAIIKISNIILGFILKKKLISVHSVMNKITGLLMFVLPFTIQFIKPEYSVATVCFVATISAMKEGKENEEV